MSAKRRPYWKGYLKFGLVTVGVDLFNGIESQSGLKFRLIHKPTGKRVNFVRQVEDKPIDNVDVVKGYEVDDDAYLIVEPEELDALKLESNKTIDLMQFVHKDEIDQRYFERPYYLAPSDDLGQEGYALIREAMRKSGMVGLAKLCIGGREWLVMISPMGKGLLVTLLRYHEELRAADEFFEGIKDVKVERKMLDLANSIIAGKTARFAPEKFHDAYAVAVKELIQEKLKHGKAHVAVSKPGAVRPPNVVDLFAALQQSVQTPAKRKKA